MAVGIKYRFFGLWEEYLVVGGVCGEGMGYIRGVGERV